MNPLHKAAQSVDAGLKALSRMLFAGGSSFSMWFLPNSRIDYKGFVGDGRQSAAVMACVSWAQRTFPEAPLRVQRTTRENTAETVIAHPLTQLWTRPNPYYSGLLLQSALLADFMLTGNAYAVKVRTRGGRPVELWWVPSTLIEPTWPEEDGRVFISHYAYSPDRYEPIRLEPSDVVHLRNGLDPHNPRKGASPLLALYREVFTDDEAANFTAALLKNMGVPGVILSPDQDKVELDQDAMDGAKASFMQKFSGDRRGEPLILSSKTKVEVLSWSPQQMNLKDLRRIPEERITAVLGIPAIVAGLGAGLDRSTYSNMAEAREAAYESFVVPTQRLFAAELHSQLLGDFEADPGRLIVDFDLSQVRVLQEDQNALHTRAREDLRAGLATLNEARAMIGLDQQDGGDVYFLPMATLVTPADELVVESPEPLAEGQAPRALPPARTVEDAA